MQQNRVLSILGKILFTLILVFIVGFIFYHSSQIGSVSSGLSTRVMDKVNATLSSMGISFSFTHHQIRKLGHLAEYMLLGFWLMLSLRVYTRRILAFIAWPMLGSLLVAVLDEFLQSYIPGRSSQVSDVLIDFAGICSGVAVGLILLLLLHLISLPFRREKAARPAWQQQY